MNTVSETNLVHTEERPQTMNAFELVNFASGATINKMFDQRSVNRSYDTHFISVHPPHEILTRIQDTLRANQYEFEEKEENIYSIKVTVRQSANLVV
jgi:hypothetical protein